MPGVIQTLRTELDKRAIADVFKEIASVGDALAKEVTDRLGALKGNDVGVKVARETVAGLKRGFDADLDALRLQVERGLVRPEEFERKAIGAAQRFNNALKTEIGRIADDPTFTVNPFSNEAKLTDDAKAAGQKVGEEFLDATIGAAQGAEIPAPDPAAAVDAAKTGGERVGEAVKEGIDDAKVPEKAQETAVDVARAMVEGIEQEIQAQKDRIKLAQAEGLLSPNEAHNAGVEVAQAHNRALLEGVRTFRQRGELTPEVLGVFTKSFEEIGDKVPPMSFFERVKHRIRSQAIGLAASFAGFFAAREIFRFAEGAVDAFLEDDKALQRVRTQVSATGKDFDDFAPRIDAVSERLRRLGAASAGQTAAGIAQLISVSGDADKSVRNIGLAADFAAKHNLTFEQGVELVGRAMVGQVTGLKKYGLAIKEGDDAVLAMAKDSQGFVESQAPNLERSVKVLSFAWSDLKSAIGEAIVDAGGGTSAIDLLSTALRNGAKWVSEHREEVARWGRALVDVATFIGKWVVVPIVRGFTLIVESFEDVGLTLDVLWQRFKFIGGGFALIAANMSDAWNAFLDRLGLRQFDAKGDETIRKLRAWGERVQAEAIRQKAEIDKKLAVLRTPPSERPKTDTAGGTDTTTGTGDETVGGAVRRVGSEKDPKNDALDKRIQLLIEALKFESTRMEALHELDKIEDQVKKRLDAGNLSLKQRIDLEDKVAKIEDARAKLLAPLDLSQASANVTEPGLKVRPAPETAAELHARIALTEEDKKIFLSETRRFLKEIGDEAPPVEIKFSDDLIQTFFENLDTFAHNAAEGIVDTFDDVFGKLLSGASNVGQALANLGKGMAKSVLREIAAMAKGKALENVAVAIEETAKGFAALASFNPAAASLHFKAAGTAALAAVKWGLVAGGAGALAGGSGGGGGGGAGNEGANRSGEGNDTVKERPTVTFFIKGGLLNTDDHRQMDELAKGIRAVTDRDVVIRRD